MIGGIYKIIDRDSSRFYVGSAVCFVRRWNYHIYRLSKRTHPNRIIQAIWNLDASRLSMVVVEVVASSAKDDLLRREQFHLDEAFQSGRNCMNVLKIAGSHQGAKRSNETKQKLSRASIGRIHSEEARAKMRVAKLGKPLSAEHRRKIGLQSAGKPGPIHTAESLSLWRKLSDDDVRMIRTMHAEGLLGTPRIASRFGCSRATVRRILDGTSYKEIL
jgi:group I intron endonuclease